MLIRNEKPEDYRIVEELIKKTFWNLSVPGCNEHYFAHQVRKSEDYIPELDFVLEEDGKIIGHIIYVKAKLVAEDGTEKESSCLLRGKCVSGGTYSERIRGRFFFLFSLKYNIIFYNVNILN